VLVRNRSRRLNLAGLWREGAHTRPGRITIPRTPAALGLGTIWANHRERR
jgi:hypothetical protein